MVPEVIFILVLLLLAGGVAWYVVRRRATHGDEDLYRLDVKLSADLKEEIQSNFDDDEQPDAETAPPRLAEDTDASAHHATRLLVGDQAPEAFRPRDYYGMAGAESEKDAPEVEDDLADTASVEPNAPEVEAEIEIEAGDDAPLSELPSLEGTLEFEADAPEPEVESEVLVEAEEETPVVEASEKVEEVPAARASVPTKTIPVVTAPEEEDVAPESETTPEPIESRSPEFEPETDRTPEPVAEALAPVITESAPEPKAPGLFARFVGGASKTVPVDLSDADDEFDAIDTTEIPEAPISVLEDLDPALAERLTTLNQRLAGLEDLVSDLEETLSVFDEVDPLDEAPATEDEADEAMAA